MHPLVKNIHKLHTFSVVVIQQEHVMYAKNIKLNVWVWIVHHRRWPGAINSNGGRTTFSEKSQHVWVKPNEINMQWWCEWWYVISNEEKIPLCRHAENGDDDFITYFGNLTKTIQLCWKINKQHYLLEDEKLVILSKHHFDSIHIVILETLTSNMQIYPACYCNCVQNAIWAGQMASWRY